MFACGCASAVQDHARVRRIEPQYDRISVPRQECTSQWVQEPRPALTNCNYAGIAAGGVAGAVLGNQVGKGNGRMAATAVAAVVGAMAGEHFANQAGWGVGWGQSAGVQAGYPEPPVREVRSCRTVHDTRTQPSGYRVEYEYRGQTHHTITREYPGRTIPVRVSVAPVAREYGPAPNHRHTPTLVTQAYSR